MVKFILEREIGKEEVCGGKGVGDRGGEGRCKDRGKERRRGGSLSSEKGRGGSMGKVYGRGEGEKERERVRESGGTRRDRE